MSIAIYMRVSDNDQSHDAQRGELERWLKGHGHKAKSVTWYIDKDSGEHMERPAIEKLKRDTFSGQIKTVVIWKLDRLSRDMRDGINTLCDWVDSGVRVVSVTQQLDLSGSVGKIVAAVLFGVAEIDLTNIRDRQKSGIAAAREKGVYQGRKKGSTKASPQRARELKDKGMNNTEIMKALGIRSRTTLNKYLGA